ncbi:MAG: hypothetical protein LBB52_06405, partial [Desulfovibrio sp.]|nr:hypothetical protein [Desulfovibrio sp.]
MDNLKPQQLSLMIQAVNAKGGDLPSSSSDPEVKSELESSEYLATARAIANSMYTSNDAREFAVNAQKAFSNYVRMGGSLQDIEDKFLLLNEGRMRIIAPKELEATQLYVRLGLKLNEQTNKLAPGTTPEEKENYVRMRAVYANGFWIFDG